MLQLKWVCFLCMAW